MLTRRSAALGPWLLVVLCFFVTADLARAQVQTMGPPVDYWVAVRPDGGTLQHWANTSGLSKKFEVTNLGVQGDSYILTCRRAGPVTCGSVSPNTLTLAAGATDSVTVNYSVGAAGTGTVTLRAWSDESAVSDTGYYAVTVIAPTYTVAVTPDNGAGGQQPANATGLTKVFTVQNTGNVTNSYDIACSQSGNVACTGTSVSQVTNLAAGASTTVTATYSTGAVGTGELRLTATHVSQGTSNAGDYDVTIVQYAVATRPDNASTPPRTANSSGHQVVFRVVNTGTVPDSYTLACGQTGPVTCTGLDVSQLTNLAPGDSALVTATYSVGAVGNGYVTLTANGTSVSDQGSWWVQVVQYNVAATPDGGTAPNQATNHGFTTTFTVENTGSTTDTYTLSCWATGAVSCSISESPDPGSVQLAPGGTVVITGYYKAAATAGTGTAGIHAVGTGSADDGSRQVQVVPPSGPGIVLVVPRETSAGRAVVAGRQPVIRALFTRPTGYAVDTAGTILKWRNEVVTARARHNRGLIEWEVDSTRQLGLGDSAQVSVKACSTHGECTEVTRWVVLPNDQKPVLAFTGMPFENLGLGFGAPFGPGLSVHQAEVETGFGVPSYTSMGASRSAGLVYSTRQSYPRALVTVDLELTWPVGTPDQVKLVLSEGVVKLDSVVAASPTCATGAVRRCRVTLQADYSASTFSAPTRKWLMVEAQVVSGATTKSNLDSVEVVLVDRRTTPYGSGWWPAGVSQLVQAGPDRLLVGPTGTATIYRGDGDSAYVPSPGNFTGLVRTPTGWELRPRGSFAKVVFDANGRLIAGVDQNGNADSVRYDGAGKVTAFRDAVGQLITLTYDGTTGRLTIWTDPGNRTSRVVIDTSNTLVYDSLSSPTTRPNTARLLYRVYDQAQRTMVLLRRIVASDDTTLVTYDSTFRRRPVQVRLPQIKDEAGVWVNPLITYTAPERRSYRTLRPLDSAYVEMKDPRNYWTRALLSRWGKPVRTWDSLGLLAKSHYDPDGFPLWSERKNGDSTRVYLAYDPARRPVKSYIVRAVGDTLRGDSLVYDGSHRVVARVDNRGNVDSAFYDVNGNVIRTRDRVGHLAYVWYRLDGLPDSTRQTGSSLSTRYAYGAWKNVIQVLSGNTTVAKIAQDGLGRDTTVDRKVRVQVTGLTSSWQWRRTRMYYNSANRVDSTVLLRTTNCADPCTVPPSGTTNGWNPADSARSRRVGWRFDREGRDSVRVNEKGVETVYVYNALGWLRNRRAWKDSVAVADTMWYDVAGNLKKWKTRRGYVITINYDSRNRDTLAVIPTLGTSRKRYGGPQDQLTRVWYDSPVDSIGGVNAEVRLGYDQRGRLKADTSYTGTIARVATYGYDPHERVSGLTDPTGTWGMRYETRGYPQWVVTPYADSLLLTFGTRGQLTNVGIHSSGPPVYRTWNFNSGGALTGLATYVSTATPYESGRYDALGHGGEDPGPPLGPVWTEQHGAGAPVDSLREKVVLDGWERLVHWEQQRVGGGLDSASFSFDRAGNIRTPSGQEVYDSTTNRLLNRLDAGATRTYVYDRAGNLVSSAHAGGTWTYGYDALDRLVSVRYNGTLIARYGYDVLGRRIAKRVYNATTGGTVGYTRFLYQGDHVTAEADSAGTLGLKFTWEAGVDRLAGVRTGAGTQYYVVTDKLGSVRGLVQRDGTWAMSQRFDPYGRLLARDSLGTALPLLRFGWTGREYDAETGFYFHRARFYDPKAMRFVQEDPSGFDGGSNLYGYVGGRALDATDPTGLVMCYVRVVRYDTYVGDTYIGSYYQEAPGLICFSDDIGGGRSSGMSDRGAVGKGGSGRGRAAGCPGRRGSGTICLAFYIRSKTTLHGVLKGDGRGPSAYSDSALSRAYVVVNPADPEAARPVINPSCYGFAPQMCVPSVNLPEAFAVHSDGAGGFIVNVEIINSLVVGPAIDATLHFTPNGRGGWSVTGVRDGYPSVEAYFYGRDGSVTELLNRVEGRARQLWGCCDQKID